MIKHKNLIAFKRQFQPTRSWISKWMSFDIRFQSSNVVNFDSSESDSILFYLRLLNLSGD